MTYELHPLCTLFPRMSGAEFEALKFDISTNGLNQPIVIHNGMILDGGNRYRACLDLGIEPLITAFDGSSVVAFVLSANLHRRHMSAGQQAAIVASAQDWATAQVQGANRYTISKTGNVTGLETVASRQAQSGASDKTQRMADKVAKVDPELAKRVAHGEISLPKAHEQVSPKAAPTTTPEDDGAPDAAEMASLAMAEQADREAIEKLLDSDDKLATAYAEIKRLNAELAQMRISRDGYMGKCNEAIALVKKRDRQIAAMERAQREAVA